MTMLLLIITTLPMIAGAIVGAVTIRSRGLPAALVLGGFAILLVENIAEVAGYAVHLTGTIITIGAVVLDLAGLVVLLLGLFLPQRKKASAPAWRPSAPGAPGYPGAVSGAAPAGFPTSGPPGVPGQPSSAPQFGAPTSGPPGSVPPGSAPLWPDERSPFEHQGSTIPQPPPDQQDPGRGPGQQPPGQPGRPAPGQQAQPPGGRRP